MKAAWYHASHFEFKYDYYPIYSVCKSFVVVVVGLPWFSYLLTCLEKHESADIQASEHAAEMVELSSLHNIYHVCLSAHVIPY